ncbi:MAG: phosphoribosylanthranilate isomerase [Sphingopyxis sp.]
MPGHRPVQSKICGLTTAATVDAALFGGASHIGFVFFGKSPRNIAPDQARALAGRAGGRARCVALFVNPDLALVESVLAVVPVDVVQCHGDESPAAIAAIKSATGKEVWKAIAVRTSADVQAASTYHGAADRILYDAKPPKGADLPGGNGLRFDWELLIGHQHALPWALSGGLDPANVGAAIAMTGAPMVDVSSGVECAPGVKDVDKIAAFLKAASS